MDPGEVAGMRSHLDECADCRQRLEEAEELGRRFSTTVYPETVEAVQRGAMPKRTLFSPWQWQLAGGLAAAAAVLAVVLLNVIPEPIPVRDSASRSGEVVGPGGQRLVAKSNSGFELYVKREGGADTVDTNDVLHPGDKVRFVPLLDKYKYVLVLIAQKTGDVYDVWYPRGGTGSMPFPTPAKGPLPGSLTLDEHIGSEEFWAFYSMRSITLEEAGNLIKTARECASVGRPFRPSAEMEIFSLGIIKEPR